MAKILMFVSALIIFLSLLSVETKQCMPFFAPFLNFLVCVINTILLSFSNISFSDLTMQLEFLVHLTGIVLDGYILNMWCALKVPVGFIIHYNQI
jgi:hypothetical protein